jgi:hypothetical protein
MEDHKEENIKENLLDPLDELMDIEDAKDKIEQHIRELWDNVIVPYLNNYRDRQILGNLTVNDYDKFYKWIINFY